MASPRRRRTLDFWLPLIAVFVVYFGLVFWAGSSLCLVRSMTGLPCPGCGLTHAAIAVVHGDMDAAIRFNALIFLFPFVAVLAIAARLWGHGDSSFRRFCNVFYITVVTVMFIYFIVRVVLFFPRGPYPMTWERNNIPNKIVTSIRTISAGLFSKPGD